jgi:S1-C subfamily serine protease
VASDGGGGYLLTNRHVVQEATGAVPVRGGAIFNGSRQNFRARVVALQPEVDLALLRVEVTGGIPVVRLPERDARLAAGDPVVVLGFPLGLDIDMGGRWREVGVATTLTAGTVSKVVPRLIQLDGYGAQGASGSPVFDAGGTVAGIVYGGERESRGRVVYAVPIRYGLELLSRAGTAP